MTVEKLSFVLPVEDMTAAVAFWAGLLGTEPTFVDGDRWAQFDHAGVRLSLGGTDRVVDTPGVMVKVSGLEAARQAFSPGPVGEVATGAHERRAVGADPDGWPVILYEPLPR